MDILERQHRDAMCCENCTNRASFQPVVDLKELGIIIMRYVADIMNQNYSAVAADKMVTKTIPAPDIKVQNENIFIIINTNKNNLSSEDILPKFDVNKITCPRCRKRVENLQKMLTSKIDIGKGDIMGICDHCKNQQIPKEPCEICKDVVKKFLDTTDVKSKMASWSPFKAPYVHRPLMSERLARLDKKYQSLEAKPKSVTEIRKYITPLESESESPTRVSKKYRPESFKKLETPKHEFPSDESIITPFVTTFSQTDKKIKDFKYVFPQDSKKDEDIVKAAVVTSSELIMDTQDKIHKKVKKEEQQEEDDKIAFDESTLLRKEERIQMPWDKVKEDEYDIYREKKFTTKEDYKQKQIKETPLGSADSKKPVTRDKENAETGAQKTAEKVSKEKLDKESIRRKDTSKDFKEQAPQKGRSEKVQEDVRKLVVKDKTEVIESPVSKDTKIKKYREDVKLPEDTKLKKDKEKAEPPPSDDTKAKKDKEKSEPPPSEDTKVKKDKEKSEPPFSEDNKLKKDEGKAEPPIPKDKKTKTENEKSEPPTPKDIKTKTEKEKIDTQHQKDIKPKTVTEKIEPSTAKDVKGKKEKTELPTLKDVKEKNIGSPTPKETKAKTEKNEIEPQPAKDVKIKKDRENLGSRPSKDVKAKKEKEEIEPTISKDVKARKGKENVEPPTSKEVKAKKGKEDVEPPPLKDVKTKKSKEVTPPPPPKAPIPNDDKSKKSKEDIELPSTKTKKTKEDIEPLSSKETKTKKGKEDIELLSSKETKAKKNKEDVESPSPKDAKTKKSKEVGPPPPPKAPPQKDDKNHKGKEGVIEPPTPKDIKAKKVKEDVESLKEIKNKKGKEDLETTKEVKAKKGKEDVDLTLSKDVPTKKGKEKGPPPPPKAPPTATKKQETEQPMKKSDKEKEAEVEGSKKEKKGDLEKGKDGNDKEISKEKEEPKKGKKKDERDEKPKVETEQVPRVVTDIEKLLTTKVQKPIINAPDKKAAAQHAEQRMKELQEAALTKAIADAKNRFALPEVHAGDYYLFKLAVTVPPPDEEKARKKKKLKEFNLKDLTIGRPSIDDLILKMVKLNEAKKQNEKKYHKVEAKYKIRSSKRAASFGSLSIDSDFELAIESLTNLLKRKVVRYKIKHVNIIKDAFEKPKRKLQPDPMFFHVVHDKSEPLQVINLEEEPMLDPELGKGIIKYKLSDHSFIDKGWTKLPTEKVVRQMHIYKVRPTNPEFDWFELNKSKRVLTYDSGERFAQFDDNGRGRWYYRNARLALDYYDCEEANAQQRFVIYSNGERDERCRTSSSTVSVLAMFDYLGNGVVFDHSGKLRVKYNQTEGVVLDRDIGPVTRWKWHTLNDPPVLKKVMIDTRLDPPDVKIMKYSDHRDQTRIDDDEMLAIEMDNTIKEKTRKLGQEFQPFQIRMKALKINKQFSLKILDQAHIYLYFREGSANIKINLGMVLDSHEIVDTDVADFQEVANSLERPPKTDSILELQECLRQARRLDRLCDEHQKQIHPTVPICSADRLVCAQSKPLRPPLAVRAESRNVKGCRKSSEANLYYDTRLI